MAEFVKICPKCGLANPEYENLCSGCGQFVGMEPSVPKPVSPPKAADAPTPAPPPARATPPPPPPGPPPTLPAANGAAAAVAVGAVLQATPVLPCYLEPLWGGAILTLTPGAVLGQAHPDSDAALQIPLGVAGAAYLHRRHCRFEREGAGWSVVALDQTRFGRDFTNPTRVNGELLPPGGRRMLRNGDELRLADLRLRVRLP